MAANAKAQAEAKAAAAAANAAKAKAANAAKAAVVCVLFDNSRGNQGPHNSWNDNAFARFQLKSFCSKYNVLMQLWL